MQTNQAIYKEYYDKVDVKDALYSRINEIKQTLSIVTEVDKWTYRYQEDKWTIKDMIQHCIDCERIFSYRVCILLVKTRKPFFCSTKIVMPI